MAAAHESTNLALFCDFENIALGVRDAKYEKFDIKLVLERLLIKGSIVVKKAYCDWERYKGFKAAMHEASFELIEIPHVRQSGKNSADIRLVVDALDLCYTKSHVDTFVIISGDSDFSPLVSKLRENAKQVIGVGVKQSTSDLLIANCDEFIFYDDLVRDVQRTSAGKHDAGGRRSAEDEDHRKDELQARRAKAIELAVETFDALVAVRGDSGKIWASVLKEAIKRQRPGFNESYYGFKAFGNLLEAAQEEGLLEVGRDDKSGTYVYRGNAPGEQEHRAADGPAQPAKPAKPAKSAKPAHKRGRSGNKNVEPAAAAPTGVEATAGQAPTVAEKVVAPSAPADEPPVATTAPARSDQPAAVAAPTTAAPAKKAARKRSTTARKAAARKSTRKSPDVTASEAAAAPAEPE